MGYAGSRSHGGPMFCRTADSDKGGCMKPEDFDLFATLVKQRSGLMLTREKAYLLESRLMPVARKYNLHTLEDMAQAVRSSRDETMMSDITEAMMTNESSFFRDLKPFK